MDIATNQIELLSDGNAYHHALYRMGDLDNPSSWHKESTKNLIFLASSHLKEGAVVVDYGAGTGGSAIELLKYTDSLGINIELILIDPLASWFAKAKQVLGNRSNIRFELSSYKGPNGNTTFRSLDEILAGRKADLIISSSTLHLIPVKALSGVLAQFSENLKPDGAFVWSSGDIDSDRRPINSVCLHDPYRNLRQRVKNQEARLSYLSHLNREQTAKLEGKIDKIFPKPFHLSSMAEAFSGTNFNVDFKDSVIDFGFEDAVRFINVPRLSEIAAPLMMQTVSEPSF